MSGAVVICPAVNLSPSNTALEARVASRDIPQVIPAGSQLAGSPQVFVPFSEDLLTRYGLSLGDLVPFHVQYTCLRLREYAPSAAADSAASSAADAAASSAADYGWSDVEIEEPA